MTDRLVVDLLDPGFYQRNPHADYAWMRANEPVYRDGRNGLWGISRHADVLEVERRNDVFVSGLGYRNLHSPTESNMIAQDDPRHQQQRRLVNRRFTPKAVRGHTGEFTELIDELIDNVIDDGHCEVIDAWAGQLPSRLTARMLGFPEDRWRDVKRWSEQLMRTDSRDRDGQVFTDFIQANREFIALLQEVAPEKVGCPADDLLSTWLHAEIDGQPLPPESIVHETGLFIAGGAETTRTAIAHGLRAFCDHPDQWELLAHHPELAPQAVEEVVRFVTPLNNFFRRAIAPATVGGQAIGSGDRIILLYPSANRDEAVFDRPMEFDITRSQNPHVGFGHGTHFCLGANFARHELAILFSRLSQRITGLTARTEPDVEPNIFARAVRSFELDFARRS